MLFFPCTFSWVPTLEMPVRITSGFRAPDKVTALIASNISESVLALEPSVGHVFRLRLGKIAWFDIDDAV